jgi:hypothetical protein
MQIIINSRTEFFNATIEKDALTGELKRIVKEKITVAPSTKPQDVPDWVANDDTFKVMEEAGSIIAVQVLTKPKTEKKIEVPAAPIAPSGWGAAPNNVGLGFESKK